MKVKICGLTNLEDTIVAIEAGADMLGFNFYSGSPRYIEPGLCSEITGALSAEHAAIPMVGVFVNASTATIANILEKCGLDLAQLHGDEPPEILKQLEGRGFKAIRPQNLLEADAEARRFAHMGPKDGPALLVDTYEPGQYGGTGDLGDWSLAGTLANRMPILLAGGLTPDNVTAALEQVRPWGVDVASGVESRPGQKNAGKLRQFIQAVRDSEREMIQR